MTGDQLRIITWLNNNKVGCSEGNNFPIVGGPTRRVWRGFLFEYGGNTYDYAVFNPGVIACNS